MSPSCRRPRLRPRSSFASITAVGLLALLAAAPAHAEDDGVKADFYGFVRPTLSVLGGSFDSFGRPNASAVTAAGNPALVDDATRLRGSWQLAQTRLGTKLTVGRSKALVEIDFIDFNLSNPTTGSKPRLRQATVGYDSKGGTQITAGQTWDAFAPLNPFHRNYVGANFTAGNLGFMRDQVIVTQHSKAVDITGALGFAAFNNNMSDGPLETNPMPTGTVRLGVNLSEKSQVGAAGFVARLPFSDTDATTAWGGNVFADLKLADKTALRGEAYIGQDLAGTGMLTLGQAVYDATTGKITDVSEAGAWLSLRQGFNKTWAMTVTASGAGLLNPEDAAPGYLPDPNGGPIASLGTAPGIAHNIGGRLGLEASVTPHLLFYGEGFGFNTDWIPAPGDGGRDLTPTRFGGELGGLFTF